MGSPTVLISGANGRTGRALIQALRGSECTIRALIRDEAQWPHLQPLGAHEFVLGNLLDSDSVYTAVTGCDTVILVGPPMDAAEVHTAERFIAGCTAANVGKIVYYSVLHPLRRSVRHHRLKLDAEQLIVESGLPYVIVQPARYMQHLDPMWSSVLATSVHAMPFSTDVLFNVVDLRDLAAAVAKVALSGDYDFGTYELVGPEALSQTDMARIISDVTGRPIRAEALALDKVAAKARAAGASDDRIEQMLVMNRHYDEHGFRGNPGVLQWIVQRPLTGFRAYVEHLMKSRPLVTLKT